MPSAWIILFIAGLFEVAFATSMKASEGFTRLWPTISFVVTSIASLALLNLAIKSIPLGTAYAVWTGIGAIGTVTAGILLFRDPVNLPRRLFLSLIIVGVFGLRISAQDPPSGNQASSVTVER